MNNILNRISRKSAGDEVPFIPAYEVRQRNGKDKTDLCMYDIKLHWQKPDILPRGRN